MDIVQKLEINVNRGANMNREILKQIGQRIYQARVNLGMTQAELAERLGVDRVEVTHYENGNRGPHISDVPLLAKVLNVPTSYFFEGDREGRDEKADQQP
jgi:transcriptional regulator with XRE-family HTH domain